MRHFRDQVTDPDLKRQVAGFIGQEAVHGREHRVLNDRLAELGYPTKQIERVTRWGLETRERIVPPIANLAATAALEHFTATLAEVLLSNDEARELFGHDELRNLFLWHALEESEHKAVAFDVYKAAGGGERMRVWTMNALCVGFVGTLAVEVTLSVLRDRDAYRAATCCAACAGCVPRPAAQRVGPAPRLFGLASIPTTTTRPSWSSAGGPSCSATTATSTTSSRPRARPPARP